MNIIETLLRRFDTIESLDREIMVAENWIAHMEVELKKAREELKDKMDIVVYHQYKALTGAKMIEGYELQLDLQKEIYNALREKREEVGP